MTMTLHDRDRSDFDLMQRIMLPKPVDHRRHWILRLLRAFWRWC